MPDGENPQRAKNIGDAIEYWTFMRGKERKWLSEVACVHRSRLSRFITGKVLPPSHVLKRIADALNVPVETLEQGRPDASESVPLAGTPRRVHGGGRETSDDLFDGSLFAYRGIVAKVRVVDALLGNLRNGYRDELVKVSIPAPYSSVGDALPHDTNPLLASLKSKFDERHAHWSSVMEARKKSMWDYRDLLAFDKVTILRHGEDEHSRIDLDVSHGSYVDHRAITDCFKELDAETKQSLLTEFQSGSKYFSRLTAISAALISADGKILFPKRSQAVTSDPGLITCGVNEAMKISDAHQRTLLSVPRRTIVRGLHEEYGVSVAAALLDRIQLFSLVQHAEYFEWYFYGWADFRGCGHEYMADRLLENLRTGKAKDKFEYTPGATVAVDFSMEEICKFIRAHHSKMTEYGISLPILAAMFDAQELKYTAAR